MPRTIADYLSLVTSFHSTRERYMATLSALLQPLVDAQNMLNQMVADFSLDTAVGVQLDMVGQWIGRTRYVDTPLTGVYFAFDLPTERVGFDQGVWFGPYSPTEGITALDDDTFRSILRLQAIANHWDGTIPSIAPALDAVFPGIVIQDMGDRVTDLMSMDVLIPSAWMNSVLLYILEQDFPVHPSGVLVNMLETSVATEPIFAFDIPFTTGGPLGGFDQAAWAIVVSST